MKNKILLISIFILFFSCEEKKPEFIQSKVYKSMYLLRNYPENDSILKTIIKSYVKKISKDNINKDFSFDIYKYTSNTEYFLENEEDDGGPTSMYFLSDCENDQIAYFTFSKCENDTTKLAGRFHYYGINHNVSEIDTIIYKCK